MTSWWIVFAVSQVEQNGGTYLIESVRCEELLCCVFAETNYSALFSFNQIIVWFEVNSYESKQDSLNLKTEFKKPLFFNET